MNRGCVGNVGAAPPSERVKRWGFWCKMHVRSAVFVFLCYQLFTVGNSNPGSAFPYICLNLHTHPAHTHALTLSARARTHTRALWLCPRLSLPTLAVSLGALSRPLLAPLSLTRLLIYTVSCTAPSQPVSVRTAPLIHPIARKRSKTTRGEVQDAVSHVPHVGGLSSPGRLCRTPESPPWSSACSH